MYKKDGISYIYIEHHNGSSILLQVSTDAKLAIYFAWSFHDVLGQYKLVQYITGIIAAMAKPLKNQG